ncbi:MAG: 3-dehydroquinate synthase [Thermodesulfobacteriota bacterium]
MNQIKVQLDASQPTGYRIYIGQDILDRVGVILNKGTWINRFVIITDSRVNRLHGQRVLETLRSMNLKVDLIDFPEGEGSKNMGTTLQLVDKLMDLGADRHTALIALGGGVTGDMTGFIASIYMRGVPFFQIPTTLMAQVDSSIGGKTGIDLPAGKNLLGTFYQPQAVFIDLDFLNTLEDKEYISGLAEIIKYGVIEDPQILATLEQEIQALKKRDLRLLEKLVGKSCRIKKRIVEMDEKEGGLRRILNFGHTLGHAVESESGYALSHGQAVGIGMVFAARLSQKLNYLSLKEAERIESLVKACALPHRIPTELKTKAVVARLSKDKKKEGTQVPFVLIKKIGLPFVSADIPPKTIIETIEDLKA